ncbi:MAG: hypothetical protein HOQ24_00870 [Mycobacteriaceae bacterium]|nr:hypothetical protein [Mycobacteriaceae bacterium]
MIDFINRGRGGGSSNPAQMLGILLTMFGAGSSMLGAGSSMLGAFN